MTKSYEASGKTVDEAIDLACALAGTTIENVEIEILELGGKGLFGLGQKNARVRVSVEDNEPEVSAPEPAAPAGGFGPRKTRKEKREKKPSIDDIEIKPILVVEPGAPVEPEEKAPRGERPPRAERPERPEKRRRSDDRRRDEHRRSDEGRDNEGEPRENREPRRESHAVDITEGEMADAIFAAAKDFAGPIFTAMGVEPEYRTELREGIMWIILDGDKLGLLIGRRGETLNAIQYLVNLAVNKHRADHVRLVLDVEGYRESREKTLTALAHKMADKAVKSGRRVELEPMNPHERRIVHMALQNDKRVETTSHGEEPYRRVVVTSKHRNRRRGNGAGSNARPPRVVGEALPNVIIQHDTDDDQ